MEKRTALSKTKKIFGSGREDDHCHAKIQSVLLNLLKIGLYCHKCLLKTIYHGLSYNTEALRQTSNGIY